MKDKYILYKVPQTLVWYMLWSFGEVIIFVRTVCDPRANPRHLEYSLPTAMDNDLTEEFTSTLRTVTGMYLIIS